MAQIIDLASRVAGDVAGAFAHNLPFLAAAIVLAAAAKVYVGADRISALLNRRPVVAVGGAVLLATLTPFCSCGTMAVMLGMLATSAPWAPIVAFIVSSPLTSPSELVFSAGLLGWRFAWVFFLGTIALGIVAGIVTGLIDRTGWLRGQARMAATEPSCPTESCRPQESLSPGPGAVQVGELTRPRRRQFITEIFSLGRTLLLFFFGFTAVGYLVIEAVPTEWLTDLLGGGSVFAVPLAALLGIPSYVNTEGSLPLVAALMDGGMGPGPAMAFLVTGAGTSLGAISGLLVIARRRVVALVVGLLMVGALVLGWLTPLVV